MGPSFMPWGKYRGEHIDDLPEEYVKWIITADCYKFLKESTQRIIAERYQKIIGKEPDEKD